MRFITGVIVGIAGAAAAAAWYLSRSGQEIREEYQIEARLGELGDQVDARAREIQAKVASQIDDIRAKSDEAGEDAASELGDVAEAAAESTNGIAEGVGTAIGQAESAVDDGPAAS